MPQAANRIDYNAISDVIIQLRYTASSSEKLRSCVIKLKPVKDYVGSSCYALAQQWSDRWFAFMRNHTDVRAQTLQVPLVAPIAPPQVEVTAVTSVALCLQVLDGASAEGHYLSITVPGDQSATPVPISADNRGVVTKQVTNYAGDWALTFKLGADGAPISITDGKWLDPAKLLNVAMVITYAGTLNWK